jgi:hypothetical protein
MSLMVPPKGKDYIVVKRTKMESTPVSISPMNTSDKAVLNA